jgi:hypothetical protein
LAIGSPALIALAILKNDHGLSERPKMFQHGADVLQQTRVGIGVKD